MLNKTHIVTGSCRFECVNLQHEDASTICLVISKRDKTTIKKIRDAVNEATLVGVVNGVWPELPPFIQDPLREYDADNYFLNAHCSGGTRPGLVGPDLETIRPEDIFSGDTGRASLDFYAYDYRGQAGVAAYLNNLQLLAATGLDRRIKAKIEADMPSDEKIDKQIESSIESRLPG